MSRAIVGLLVVVGLVFVGIAAVSTQAQRVEGGLGTNGSQEAFDSLGAGSNLLFQSVGLTALVVGIAAVFVLCIGVVMVAVGVRN